MVTTSSCCTRFRGRWGTTSVADYGDTVTAIVDEARQLCALLKDLPAGPLAPAAAAGIRAFDGLGGRG